MYSTGIITKETSEVIITMENNPQSVIPFWHCIDTMLLLFSSQTAVLWQFVSQLAKQCIININLARFTKFVKAVIQWCRLPQ